MKTALIKRRLGVIAASLLLACFVIWSVALVRGIFARRGAIEETSALLGKLIEAEKLNFHNEVLTHSARLYVETGEKKWKTRYGDSLHSLRDLLARLGSSGLTNIEETLQRTQAALMVFTEIEKSAFEVAESGDKPEAKIILTGPEYARQKNIYAEAVEDSIMLQKEGIVGRLNTLFQQQKGSFYQLYALAAVFFILAFAVTALLFERKALEEERLRVERELYHSQKVEALGRMAAGIVHELKSPLGTILGLSEVGLSDKNFPSEFRKDMEMIREAGMRCQSFIKSLLGFGRKEESGDLKPCDLNEVLEESCALVRAEFSRPGLVLEKQFVSVSPKISAEREQIVQVALNLILNAVQALGGGGRIRLRSGVHNSHAFFEVEDNGPGVPAHAKTKIFDPFFTTKKKGEGTGLGLSICQSILMRHRGKLIFADAPGGGAIFRVELPLI